MALAAERLRGEAGLEQGLAGARHPATDILPRSREGARRQTRAARPDPARPSGDILPGPGRRARRGPPAGPRPSVTSHVSGKDSPTTLLPAEHHRTAPGPAHHQVTRSPAPHRLGAGAGLVAGLVLAAAALWAWRLPPGTGQVGADVAFIAGATGELGVTPTGRIGAATGLEPAGATTQVLARVEVFNRTGVRLATRLRALPSVPDLDALLLVEVEAGGESLYRGLLGGLRSWTARVFLLDPAERGPVEIRARLVPSVGERHRGQIAEIPLEFSSERAEG